MFASAAFMEFHQRLITNHFASGLVQIVRLSAGSEDVGLIYNLVHRGKVYFYQCGYAYGSDKRLSPGTLAVSQVIEHCLAEGFEEFDLLSGGSGYKARLATGSRTLVWARFRRPGLRCQAITLLRRAKTAISKH